MIPATRPITLPVDSIDLSQYTPAELTRLKGKVEARLPQPESLDLQAELIAQFQSAKALFVEAQQDRDTPVNQLASVCNTAAALLKQLAATQIDLYTAERNRCMEAALIDLLKEADPEDREAFLADYAARLEAIK